LTWTASPGASANEPASLTVPSTIRSGPECERAEAKADSTLARCSQPSALVPTQ
jgi:hypothetical protein